MKLLILAGGFGTRLRNVLGHIPKALAPVGSIPFLHYQLEHWIAQGLESFVFLLHHKADLIEQFLQERQRGILKGCRVELITEPHPMDTGGAVAYAVRKLGLEGEFIVTNADTWLGSGVHKLCVTGADAMILVRHGDVSRYGVVEIDGEGLVSAFCEKGNRRGGGWINAGMGIFKAEHFKEWDGQRLSLENDIFPKLLAERRLKAITLESDFIDIGIPEDYWRFCQWKQSSGEFSL